MLDSLLIFVINLLIPLAVWLGGLYMLVKCPDNMSKFIGYRTTRSMKNTETWNFANRYAGRIYTLMGMALTLLTAVLNIPFLNDGIETLTVISFILWAVELPAVFVPIFFTESALKKNFDNDGNKCRNEDRLSCDKAENSKDGNKTENYLGSNK